MTTSTYSIYFDFLRDAGRIKIRLFANVLLIAGPAYVVNNFQLADQSGQSLLPEMTLQKAAGEWVHQETGKSSDLSVAIGQAIDNINQMRLQ